MRYEIVNTGTSQRLAPVGELLQLGDSFVFHNGGTKVLGYNWDYDLTTSTSKYSA